MADHIKIHPAKGTWVVRAKGAVFAESGQALELREGDYPTVIYFPRKDVGMEFLEKSSTSTVCPHKGVASHYTIAAKSAPIPDAAWSYETPIEGMEQIAGYLGFYADKVTVEEL